MAIGNSVTNAIFFSSSDAKSIKKHDSYLIMIMKKISKAKNYNNSSPYKMSGKTKYLLLNRYSKLDCNNIDHIYELILAKEIIISNNFDNSADFNKFSCIMTPTPTLNPDTYSLLFSKNGERLLTMAVNNVNANPVGTTKEQYALIIELLFEIDILRQHISRLPDQILALQIICQAVMRCHSSAYVPQNNILTNEVQINTAAKVIFLFFISVSESGSNAVMDGV
ncbi:hypothetical protein ABH309_21970 [Chromobacterium piscinae]|uniref:Uncharacterized protein n=1 Tax=Chromobacterium piscinae TaxID=686831 RepID=A0ABV0HBA8_9NEIS